MGSSLTRASHPRRRFGALVGALSCLVSCSLFAPTYGDYAQGLNDASGAGGTGAGSVTAGALGAGSGGGGQTSFGGDTMLGEGGRSDDGGSAGCVGDACPGLECPDGFGDCNAAPADGCETALGSLDHCGGCETECTNEHGTTACMSPDAPTYACKPSCAPGYDDCDLNPNNGCETNINTDSTHCGSCTLACPANGGTPRCQGGVCGVSSCNPGFGDCKNVGKCDVNLNNDPSNCGNCGHACSSEHGVASCSAGVCHSTCDAGWGDCNATPTAAGPAPDDGCETKLNVADSGGSVPNCGACGALCQRKSLTTVDVAQCAKGMCVRNCNAGCADCDKNANNGCEVVLSSNASNCGACGKVCGAGTTCSSSVCK